jgi:hypothetical protein
MQAVDGTPDYGLLDRSGLAGMIFYPRRDRRAPPPGAEDIAVETDDGASLACRFYPTDATLPAVLYFHGNGEVASDYDGFAPFYHRAGLSLFVADYRGYGASSGTPTFAALVGDARPVLDRFHALLDERGFGGPRFVMGRSLGGYPAAEAAAMSPERLVGLILESTAPLLDGFARRFGATPTPEMEALSAAHRERATGITLPVLALHGEWDELIPLERAVAFYDALAMREPHKELVIIPGAGHNDIFWVAGPRYFEAIGSFVARVSGESV